LDRTNAGEDGEIVKVNSEMMHPLYKLSEAAGDLTSEYVKSHPSPATLQDEPAPAQSLFGGTPTAVAPAANNMFAMGSVAPLVRDKENSRMPAPVSATLTHAFCFQPRGVYNL